MIGAREFEMSLANARFSKLKNNTIIKKCITAAAVDKINNVKSPITPILQEQDGFGEFNNSETVFAVFNKLKDNISNSQYDSIMELVMLHMNNIDKDVANQFAQSFPTNWKKVCFNFTNLTIFLRFQNWLKVLMNYKYSRSKRVA